MVAHIEDTSRRYGSLSRMTLGRKPRRFTRGCKKRTNRRSTSVILRECGDKTDPSFRRDGQFVNEKYIELFEAESTKSS
jgi:hypothetical protein